VDPSKVKDVLNWNPPIDVSEIHSFLGLAGYFGDSLKDLQNLLNL
jgi:hypothetical protein